MRPAVFVLGLCLCTSLRAENAVGYTAEWLAQQSELIAIGTPGDVENIQGPGDVWFTKVRFQLSEVVKGNVSAGDQVTVFDYAHKEQDRREFAQAKRAKKSLLLFATTSEHLFREIDGKYVLTVSQEFKSAYPSDQPVARLYTPEFKLLTRYDELLQRARKQSRQEEIRQHEYWKGRIVRKALEVPPDAEIYPLLDAGSAVHLWYPEFIAEPETKPSDK
jgi:hypothetical protein